MSKLFDYRQEVPESYSPIELVCNAVRSRRYDLVDQLMDDPDIDINDLNSDGQTALHIAVMQDDVKMVEKLCSYLADPTVIDMHGKTPMQYNTNNEAITLKLKEQVSEIHQLHKQEKEMNRRGF